MLSPKNASSEVRSDLPRISCWISLWFQLLQSQFHVWTPISDQTVTSSMDVLVRLPKLLVGLHTGGSKAWYALAFGLSHSELACISYFAIIDMYVLAANVGF